MSGYFLQTLNIFHVQRLSNVEGFVKNVQSMRLLNLFIELGYSTDPVDPFHVMSD